MQRNLEDDSSSLLSEVPSITLADGEVISPLEWKRRFDDEWYNGNRNGDFTILKGSEAKAEARRNNNVSNRDALSVAEKTGSLVELTYNEDCFMQDVSDDFDWKNAYKIIGIEGAAEAIYSQARRDLESGNINKALEKFHMKMTELKAIIRREKRKDR